MAAQRSLVKEEALVFAAPYRKKKKWIIIAILAAAMLIIVPLVVVTLTNEDAERNVRGPTYTESMQYGNTILGDGGHFGNVMVMSRSGSTIAVGARTRGTVTVYQAVRKSSPQR